ncbi:regulator of chromosome condensation 1/beta-lactamase-inhibitor protein II [Baffinella frigidus]|nr:regulator of chromosome condensation 1/beta-lactamase-inhibitor protein II [Cryptophyta sp. CCMP2293]
MSHATRVVVLRSGRCALLFGGDFVCWGNSNQGQLGDGTAEMGSDLPVVDVGGVVVSFSVGVYHTCVLLLTDQVKCWGDPGQGRSGYGDAIVRGSAANQMGGFLPAVDVGSGTPTALSAGDGHSCVLFSDGSVKCWGNNGEGQLGVGDTDNRGDAPDEMGPHAGGEPDRRIAAETG